MAPYTMELILAGDVEEGKSPGSVAYLTLQRYGHDDDTAEILVSHQCVGSTELEDEVGRLKAELDEPGRKGRQEFQKHRMRTVDAFGRKHQQQ